MISLLDRVLPRAKPTIAPAGPDDAALAAVVHGQSFARGWSEDEFAALLRSPTTLAHRALVRGRLAGFILSRFAAGEAEILSVAVARRHRGRGLAGLLLEAHLRRLAGLAIRAVFLEVEDGNTSARRLYARAGFREVGRRPGYYGKAAGAPGNALILRHDLAA